MFWDDRVQWCVLRLYHLLPALLALIPALAVAAWARGKVAARRGHSPAPEVSPSITGERVAAEVLEAAGVVGVAIVEASGPLANFYDPRRRELRLSAAVLEGRSPEALAIAAHEAGRASQDARLLTLRTLAVFASGLGSVGAWLLIVAGLAMDFLELALYGDALLWASLLAALALLPLERDANRRVRRALADAGLGALDASPRFAEALAAASLAQLASTFPLGTPTMAVEE